MSSGLSALFGSNPGDSAVELIFPRPGRGKFQDPDFTADGSERARVALTRLETLWFNTGTLCNLACSHCYIESSPRNDQLVYLTLADLVTCLDEVQTLSLPTREIGFTGGEPCMNPAFPQMLRESLGRGFQVLVLTNAMRPMEKIADELLQLQREFGDRLSLRVSVDHYLPEKHEQERGAKSWAPMLKGLVWLARRGFNLRVAGRRLFGETEAELRAGFAELFRRHAIPLDAFDAHQLVIFPEMPPETDPDVPEITTECWQLLGVNPADMMCATSRMVLRKKGDPNLSVAPCTLLPYHGKSPGSLAEALGETSLNHAHCASFCVLGGGSCSA